MEYDAIDTETLNGSCRIIASSKEYMKVDNFRDILYFLTKPSYKSKILWSYNLNYDVQAIIKPLLLENCEYWKEISRDILSKEGFNYGNYNISYFGKSFKINNGHHNIKMYDLAQFYEYQSLESASIQYLNDKKNDSVDWVKHVVDYQNGIYTLEEIEKYLVDNQYQIGMYCQKDCILTKKLAYVMQKAYLDAGFNFDNPLSQAKIAEKHISNYTRYPKSNTDILKKYENFVKLSYFGGLFETYITGLIDRKIYNYDINSAYPDVMKDFDNWYNGYFYEVEQPSKNVKYGWYLTFFDCQYIPFANAYTQEIEIFLNNIDLKIPVANYNIVYPTGYRLQVLTRCEIDLLKKYGYKYKVYKGIEWEKVNDKFKNPFGWIEKAYEKRLEIKKKDKNDMRQYALKKTYNSSYGKTAQFRHGIGQLTNFFYASYITAKTRCRVAEQHILNDRYIIEIATDGVYSLVPLNLDIGENLGQWEETIYEKGLILGSGMKQLFKENDKYETYLRGVTNNRNLNLLEILQNNKDKSEIPFIKNRPIKIRECLAQVHKLNVNDLNQFKNVTRKLKINSDKKHKWSVEYNNFGEMLEKNSYANQFNVSELKPFGKVIIPKKI